MKWSVAEAKSRFSEVIRSASREPQLIMNRGRLVAAVVDSSAFEAYASWAGEAERPTLADAFAELRVISAEEGYTLDPGIREDRENAFADALPDTPV